MRRKARVQEKLEKLSVADGLRAIRFAEVVIVVLRRDHSLREAGPADRRPDRPRGPGAGHRLQQVGPDRGPAGSAGRTAREDRAAAAAGARHPRGAGFGRDRARPRQADGSGGRDPPRLEHAASRPARLNRWLEGIIAHHPPPAVAGRRLKIKYMTQVKTRPPGFVLSCTRPDDVPQSYVRYLVNGLRESFRHAGRADPHVAARIRKSRSPARQDAQLMRRAAAARPHCWPHRRPLTAPSRLMHQSASPVGHVAFWRVFCASTSDAARRAAASRDKRSFLSPFIVGLGIWIGFPTVAAYQDMASLVSGIEAPERRAGTPSSRGPSPARSMPPKCLSSMPTSRPARSPDRACTRPASAPSRFAARVARPDTRRSPHHPRRQEAAASSSSPRSRRRRPSTPARCSSAPACCCGPTAGDVEDGLRQARHPRQGNPDRHRLLHARRPRRDPGVPAMLACLVNNDKPDVLATAYAPAEPDYAEAVALREPAEGPERHRPVHPADRRGRPCLDERAAAAARLLGEASRNASPPASTSRRAAKACAARRPSPRSSSTASAIRPIPNTICGVVYQNENWRNRCQFSFACDGIKDRDRQPAASTRRPRRSRMAVTAGKIFLPEVGSSTHYYAHLCQPALGALDAEDEEDRPAHLLPHLWRRLELSRRRAARDARAPHDRAADSRAWRPERRRTMSHFAK